MADHGVTSAQYPEPHSTGVRIGDSVEVHGDGNSVGDAQTGAALDTLGEVASRADVLHDCLQRMRRETGSAVCCDGQLNVTVDGYGIPVEVRIGRPLMLLRPEAIGQLVVDACAEAVQELKDRQEEMLEEAVF